MTITIVAPAAENIVAALAAAPEIGAPSTEAATLSSAYHYQNPSGAVSLRVLSSRRGRPVGERSVCRGGRRLSATAAATCCCRCAIMIQSCAVLARRLLAVAAADQIRRATSKSSMTKGDLNAKLKRYNNNYEELFSCD